MTQDDILRMAQDAGLYSGNPRTPSTGRMIEKRLERFADLIKQHLVAEGYRKCAEGQRTTQYCGQLEAAVAAEREECAKIAESFDPYSRWSTLCVHIANTIRSRGEE
jgi:hypothetical protein